MALPAVYHGFSSGSQGKKFNSLADRIADKIADKVADRVADRVADEASASRQPVAYANPWKGRMVTYD